MATKPMEISTDSTNTNGKVPKWHRTSKKVIKASDKKVLSRKEKLESVRKANQALLKALNLM